MSLDPLHMLDVATTRILHLSANAHLQPRDWIWPLPILDGLKPCIIAVAKDLPPSYIDIGYQDRSSASSFVPVFAVQNGVIAYANGSNGNATLSIDHAGGWSTQYAELDHVFARPTDRFLRRRKARIRAGDVLGHARRSSLRIRFALSRLTEAGVIIIDPAELMRSWSLLPWFEDPRPSQAPNRVAA